MRNFMSYDMTRNNSPVVLALIDISIANASS